MSLIPQMIPSLHISHITSGLLGELFNTYSAAHSTKGKQQMLKVSAITQNVKTMLSC